MMIRTCESCKTENVWTVYVEDLAGANVCRDCINEDFDMVEQDLSLEQTMEIFRARKPRK